MRTWYVAEEGLLEVVAIESDARVVSGERAALPAASKARTNIAITQIRRQKPRD